MSNLTIAEKIQRARNNPLAFMTGVIDSIDAMGRSDVSVVDASNPFVQLLEVSALTLQASVDEQQSIVRALYPKLSETREEVFRHLSDRDKLNIHALPTRATITLAISVEEIMARAVTIPGTSIRKLTVPPQTRFKANGVEFGIHYPIDIRVLSHGSLRAVWNNDSVTSPIDITENILDTQVRKLSGKNGGLEYFLIDIPVEQFTLETFTATVTASGFKNTYAYADDFYFARVYISKGAQWQEVATTFSNTVYDVNTVTAVLEVQDAGLSVSIPQVYFSHGVVGNSVRVDLYSTRGVMELSLSNIDASGFAVEWRDFDDIQGGRYVTPLVAISSIVMRGTGTTKGGRDALDLPALRDRVTNGSAGGATPYDLVAQVNALGYDITRQYDNSTSRVYLLSRHLDTVSSSHFSTVGVLLDSLNFRFEDLATMGADVNVHLNSVTIRPSTLYQSTPTGLKVIAPPELKNPTQYTEDEVIAVLNTEEPLYSPFHYVLENRNEYFNKRCYLMDQPKILSRNFIDANGSYPYDLSMKLVQVSYRTDGYRVAIQVKSGDSIKLLDDSQVKVQLAFTPTNSARRVYITGELSPSYVDNERVFTFVFGTEFEIDDSDVIRVNDFRASETDTNTYSLGLVHEFDVIFTVNGVSKVGESSDIDELMGLDMIPADSIAITHEVIKLELGTRLQPLEGRTLTYFEEAKYEEWVDDVPLLHERPKYRDDASGYIDVSVSGGELQYQQIADIGDPVLDSKGNPRYIHRAGDLKLTDGAPVLIEEGFVSRSAGLVLFNAMFRYASEPTAATAVRAKTSEIREYVKGDLITVGKLLPPRTEVQFVPKSNLGRVRISESTGQDFDVKAGLTFQVDLYLTSNAYKDIDSHNLLKNQVRTVIIERVKDPILSTLSLEEAIKSRIGDSLVTCNVSGLTEAKVQVAALQAEDKSFSIAPVMTMLSDGKITPKDAININITSVSGGDKI